MIYIFMDECLVMYLIKMTNRLLKYKYEYLTPIQQKLLTNAPIGCIMLSEVITNEYS